MSTFVTLLFSSDRQSRAITSALSQRDLYKEIAQDGRHPHGRGTLAEKSFPQATAMTPALNFDRLAVGISFLHVSNGRRVNEGRGEDGVALRG